MLLWILLNSEEDWKFESFGIVAVEALLLKLRRGLKASAGSMAITAPAHHLNSEEDWKGFLNFNSFPESLKLRRGLKVTGCCDTGTCWTTS